MLKVKGNKCLGIDLSTQNIAFCLLSISELLGFSIQLNRWKNHKTRREIIRECLILFKPDYVVMESVRLFHKGFINIDVIKRLGGLAYLVIDFFDCKVYSVDTRTWKKVIFGSAKMDKEYSAKYVKDKYNMIVSNNDIGDAICLAEIGLRMQEFPEKFKEIE